MQMMQMMMQMHWLQGGLRRYVTHQLHAGQVASGPDRGQHTGASVAHASISAAQFICLLCMIH